MQTGWTVRDVMDQQAITRESKPSSVSVMR